MALSDSTFLLDIRVEQIERLDQQAFTCKARFGDLVETCLLDLTQSERTGLRRPRKNKYKAEINRENSKKYVKKMNYRCAKKEFGQTIILINKVQQIILNMDKYNLELSLWNKTYPDLKIGSTIIPWDQTFYSYLRNISISPRLPPVVHKKEYNVVNSTKNRVATIKITIKLLCTSSNFYSFIGSKKTIISYRNYFSNPEIVVKLLHTVKNRKPSAEDSKDQNNLRFENCVSESVHWGAKNFIAEMNEANIMNGTYDFPTYTVNSKFGNTESKSKGFITEKKYKTFDYIFGDNECFKNRIYCVNYFTVKKDKSSTSSSTSMKSSTQKKRFYVTKCNSECNRNKTQSPDIISTHSLNLQTDVSSLLEIVSCKEISCGSRVHRKLPISTNATTGMDFTNVHGECCNLLGKVEEVKGQVVAKVKYAEDQCYCSCKCRFGFTKQTRYCNICGGYEIAGDDLMNKIPLEMPMPCPIFHKLIDKNKLKNLSTSGSETKRKGDESLRSIRSIKGSPKASSDKRLPVSDKKVVESEKDSKKEEKENRNRIQFTYAYKAPQIGHSHCASPCTGMLDNVPKSMGWFWTADDCPGMKYRQMWKPGAINKQVLRLLRLAKTGEEVSSKKKKKEVVKYKRPLKRPLITVHKLDGEYTVTMETMKMYSKPRAIHQQPYEDKPALIYTIGRTEEENKQRQKKRDRERRRLERDQRMYLQSAFKNMCHEICIKTYQQALGILPNAEDPDCPCYAPPPIAEGTDMDLSCSCSEDSRSWSETDCDEWLVEFTPPNAQFDPSIKGKKSIKTDNSTQYTYLDFRVKLVDRYGNPVPRFFKGPDGKQECSDLGGFFSQDRKWLEINVDGYIGPDERWAPNTFIGPDGEQVDAESGKFQDKNMQWLVVGVDGYVNAQGKWRSYSKYRGTTMQQKRPALKKLSKRTATRNAEKNRNNSIHSLSCFGDASPTQLSKLGISGHGKDKRFLLSKFKDMVDHDQNTVSKQKQKLGRGK